MLLMGKSTIKIVIFNSYVSLPEGMYFFCVFLGRVQLQPMADWQITSAGQVTTGGPLGRKLLEIGLIPDLER